MQILSDVLCVRVMMQKRKMILLLCAMLGGGKAFGQNAVDTLGVKLNTLKADSVRLDTLSKKIEAKADSVATVPYDPASIPVVYGGKEQDYAYELEVRDYMKRSHLLTIDMVKALGESNYAAAANLLETGKDVERRKGYRMFSSIKRMMIESGPVEPREVSKIKYKHFEERLNDMHWLIERGLKMPGVYVKDAAKYGGGADEVFYQMLSEMLKTAREQKYKIIRKKMKEIESGRAVK
ncbi:hypothetical protein Dip518_000445 [Parelusimicrobium proximum]|uniref:hypothetical protein n=1 Tax=Parelusimicrobium proximum TaxID=3228953 RepID=UPI003D17FE5C